jgi:hypothetical protein
MPTNSRSFTPVNSASMATFTRSNKSRGKRVSSSKSSRSKYRYGSHKAGKLGSGFINSTCTIWPGIDPQTAKSKCDVVVKVHHVVVMEQ